MTRNVPVFALLGFAAASVLLGTPALLQQWSATARTREVLAGKTPDERAALLDNPAFAVAREIADAVPPEACVALQAYAGPAALDYYKARFAYLLYPRRVHPSANSEVKLESCDYLAVFRDTPQNLAQDPFRGEWNQEELDRYLAGYESVHTSRTVQVYRVRGR